MTYKSNIETQKVSKDETQRPETMMTNESDAPFFMKSKGSSLGKYLLQIGPLQKKNLKIKIKS